ncbi:hypothetical protein CYLTODRAFT_489364 [Cylindrobasidium torrendii FP15055 ss-10]|uniref:Uncharacterized protein n=1 Tax=Cylindrobasidium torrendii FP15055 ss-10 TaxID=1314674 RepID=A0A0D7BFR3_9AGAR|nr:hypothetical protein CYLTODRAFT_489364 [Cylindrobasidium torrendii FP15055 ss-10]
MSTSNRQAAINALLSVDAPRKPPLPVRPVRQVTFDYPMRRPSTPATFTTCSSSDAPKGLNAHQQDAYKILSGSASDTATVRTNDSGVSYRATRKRAATIDNVVTTTEATTSLTRRPSRLKRIASFVKLKGQTIRGKLHSKVHRNDAAEALKRAVPPPPPPSNAQRASELRRSRSAGDFRRMYFDRDVYGEDQADIMSEALGTTAFLSQTYRYSVVDTDGMALMNVLV